MSSVAPSEFEADLELAARVQASLLPKVHCCLGGWEIAFSYRAARHVSGDYVDLIKVSPNSFYFVLGDVSGKGVAAALLMAHLHATIRVLLGSGLPLDRVVRETSSSFCQSSLTAQFVTLVIGNARRSGEIELINAGQNPALFVHDGAATVLPATEIPLGLFCELEPSQSSTPFHLDASRGDILLLYSDGVTETAGANGAEYGLDGLQSLLTRKPFDSSEEVVAAINEDLRSFSSDSVLADDRTVLALKFSGLTYDENT